MATYTNEDLYYKDGEEIVRFGLRKVNQQRDPISSSELKAKWEKVSEMK